MAREKQKATKLYVGKTFSLKQHKDINVGKGRRATGANLGQILIIDETLKTVEALTPWQGGTIITVKKFYLHSEIKEVIDGNPVGELGKILTELSLANKTLRSSDHPHFAVNKRLDKLIRRIRLVMETLEKETKT